MLTDLAAWDLQVGCDQSLAVTHRVHLPGVAHNVREAALTESLRRDQSCLMIVASFRARVESQVSVRRVSDLVELPRRWY